MEIWETVLVNMKCDGVSEDDIVKKEVNNLVEKARYQISVGLVLSVEIKI